LVRAELLLLVEFRSRQQLLCGPMSGLQRAFHGCVVSTAAGGFARKEEDIVGWFRQLAMRAGSAAQHVAVSTTRERIIAPVVGVPRPQLLRYALAAHTQHARKRADCDRQQLLTTTALKSGNQWTGHPSGENRSLHRIRGPPGGKRQTLL